MLLILALAIASFLNPTLGEAVMNHHALLSAVISVSRDPAQYQRDDSSSREHWTIIVDLDPSHC